MRTSTVVGCIAVAPFFAVCDGRPVTAPDTGVPEAQVLLTHGGAPTQTTYTLTFTGLTPISQVVLPSGVVILHNQFTFAMEGDWEGVVAGPARQVVHRNGLITNNALFTFEGSVQGLEGTVDFRHASVFETSAGVVTAVKQGNNAILRGTEELAGLRGHGPIGFVSPGVFEGVFHVHFVP